MKNGQLLTLPAAAAALGVSARTMRFWAAEGKLPAIRLGAYYRIPRDFIDQTVEAAYKNCRPRSVADNTDAD
jgi:excisionase family DNA binding protein